VGRSRKDSFASKKLGGMGSEGENQEEGGKIEI